MCRCHRRPRFTRRVPSGALLPAFGLHCKHRRCPRRGELPDTVRPSGFSLIELLIVIAIVGILISLLMPAVQQAREAARRTGCASNLKQIALAALAYESRHGTLPPSRLKEEKPEVEYGPGSRPPPFELFNQEEGRMFSWAVALLPYMEQQRLYDEFQFDRPLTMQTNHAQEAFPPLYMCPTDSPQGRYFVDGLATNGRLLAKGNYAAYVSPYHIDLQLVFPGAISGEGLPISRIPDGTSNTLAFAEVRTRDHPQDERGAWSLAWTGASLLSFDMHHAGLTRPGQVFVPSSRSVGNTQPPNNAIGAIEERTYASGFTLVLSLVGNRDMLKICPDELDADVEKMPCFRYGPYRGWLSAAPRSLHPGGVNAVFADGHVVFLPNDVDDYAMAYLVSVNDGEIVELDKVGL